MKVRLLSLAFLLVLGGCLGENRKIERQSRASAAAVTSREDVAHVRTRGIGWNDVDGDEFWPADEWDVRPIRGPRNRRSDEKPKKAPPSTQPTPSPDEVY